MASVTNIWGMVILYPAPGRAFVGWGIGLTFLLQPFCLLPAIQSFHQPSQLIIQSFFFMCIILSLWLCLYLLFMCTILSLRLCLHLLLMCAILWWGRYLAWPAFNATRFWATTRIHNCVRRLFPIVFLQCTACATLSIVFSQKCFPRTAAGGKICVVVVVCSYTGTCLIFVFVIVFLLVRSYLLTTLIKYLKGLGSLFEGVL